MAKELLTIKDWSGGMNNRRDPRDLIENQYSYINNMSIDAIGKIKSAGEMYAHIEGSDGSTDLSEYIVECTNSVFQQVADIIFFILSLTIVKTQSNLLYTQEILLLYN